MINFIRFNLQVYLRNRLFWMAVLLTNIFNWFLVATHRYPTPWGVAARFRTGLLPLAFLISLLVMVFLITEESAGRVDSLVDSYSYSGPVWLVSKWLSLTVLAVGLFTQLLLVGVLSQLSTVWQTNWDVYLVTWLVYILPAALWCAALALAVGLLVGNRLLSAALVVLYWMLIMITHKQVAVSHNLDWAVLIDFVGDTVHVNLNHHVRWDYFWTQLLLHRFVYVALAAAVVCLTIGVHKIWRDSRFRVAALAIALSLAVAAVGAASGLVYTSNQVRGQVQDYAQALYEARLATVPGREEISYSWGLPDLGWREQSYDLDVLLDHKQGLMSVSGDVEFMNIADATDQLFFTLAHTLTVEDLKWGGRDLAWQRNGNLVVVQLPDFILSGESLTFSIGYTGLAHVPVADTNVHHRFHLGQGSLHFPHSMGWYPVAFMREQETLDTGWDFDYQVQQIRLDSIRKEMMLVHHPADFTIRLDYSGDYPLWTNGKMSGDTISAGGIRGLTLVGGQFIQTQLNSIRILSPGLSPVNSAILSWLDIEHSRYQGIISLSLPQLTVLVSDLGIQTDGWILLSEMGWLHYLDRKHYSSWASNMLTEQLLEQWWGGGYGFDSSFTYRTAAGYMMADFWHLEHGEADPAVLLDPAQIDENNFFQTRWAQGLYSPRVYNVIVVELWSQLVAIYQDSGAERVKVILNDLHQRFVQEGMLTQRDWDELVIREAH